MARPIESSIQGQVHVFRPELRFETQLQFRVRDALGRRAWRNLPTLETSPQGSGRVALMQAAALVRGKLPTPQALARASRARTPTLTLGDLLVRLPAFEKGLQARWHPDASLLLSSPSDAGPVLACLSGVQGLSWALVVGWVQMPRKTSGVSSPDTDGLLLLDPRLAAPWGNAYNARFLPGESRWRGLDGEVQRCELLGLAELSAR